MVVLCAPSIPTISPMVGGFGRNYSIIEEHAITFFILK
jgi:hypothetical protein